MPFFLLATIGAVVAFGVTAVATVLVRRAALRWAWTDAPDGHRKLHSVVTPSAGGIAIFAGAAGATAFVLWAAGQAGLGGAAGLHPIAYVGALAMVAVGAYDDVHGMGFKPKFAVEVLVAYALLHGGYRIDLSALPFIGSDVYLGALYSIPLTILWVVGVINAVNLIDGIDGLASGVVAIAFASMALAFGIRGDLTLVLVALVFVGALAGFLVHNFNPASIFMGDSGSLFLGYVLAVYTLSSPANSDPALAPVVPLLALGFPLLDTSLSMARRVAERRGMFAADRDHIHHRMADRMSVPKAVAALYLVSAGFGMLAVVASSTGGVGVAMTVAAAVALAAGLIVRLGYVRLPYDSPQLVEVDPNASAPASVTRPPDVAAPDVPAAGAPEDEDAEQVPDLAPHYG
ncbi:MraY family glycosyltransferase [Rubrivirga sp. S365]|uniref:MraY family glycosyltransferase n=1 Tax=Rubrivirga litoralis TaxID=3075598 RepID=A0ABU3BPL8_9BACT|nr:MULTISPECIES: MraY family glycosyltransferase [unclassified Rubrivirga]MDT0631227.1 MraY family glycosyltransferase [Rubrivirga sp. F394]MDT7856630.1 MraY family glycosyltransferase [Rubrivirga sp. S365]